MDITEPDEVWCTDITYIPMPKGHAYLVAIMDYLLCKSAVRLRKGERVRAVLAWEVSNTMDTAFCLRALRRAIASTGRVPGIFNTDQGSQFTSKEWVGGDRVARNTCERGREGAVDGQGVHRAAMACIKYEKLRLWSYRDIPELERHIADWMSSTPWGLSRRQKRCPPRPDPPAAEFRRGFRYGLAATLRSLRSPSPKIGNP